MLSLVTIPLHAQSLLSTLNQHQEELESETKAPVTDPKKAKAKKPGPAEVSSSGVSASVNAAKCDENDQTSLPLSYVTSLILSKGGHLDVNYDPRKSTVTVAAPDMISNCSSMIEWKLKEQEIAGARAYAIEAKLKEGDNCTDQGCEYKVAKVEGGAFKEYQRMTLKPTLKGFEECLSKAGVIARPKVTRIAAPSMPRLPLIREASTGVPDWIASRMTWAPPSLCEQFTSGVDGACRVACVQGNQGLRHSIACCLTGRRRQAIVSAAQCHNKPTEIVPSGARYASCRCWIRPSPGLPGLLFWPQIPYQMQHPVCLVFRPQRDRTRLIRR